jgi:hypothetical protein
MELFKWFLIVVLVLFTAYTVYCNLKESFFKSFKEIWKLHFGRQAVVDLYIGLLLFGFFVYLIEGSWVTTLLWMLPALPFVNIVALIYVVVNFEKIVLIFS